MHTRFRACRDCSKISALNVLKLPDRKKKTGSGHRLKQSFCHNNTCKNPKKDVLSVSKAGKGQDRYIREFDRIYPGKLTWYSLNGGGSGPLCVHMFPDGGTIHKLANSISSLCLHSWGGGGGRVVHGIDTICGKMGGGVVHQPWSFGKTFPAFRVKNELRGKK
jgi:hypothetical protein